MQEMQYGRNAIWKYMAEIEAHADIIIQICKDYGKEVGEAIAVDIGSGEAEKMMLLGVMRYILDEYMDGGK
jgi:hypothetical protein